MHYFATITEEDGQFLVTFPDCPGCVTYGNTKEEALTMAADALDGWLSVALDCGDIVPRPTWPQEHGVSVRVSPILSAQLEAHWNEPASEVAKLRAEVERLTTRQQELLATIVRITNEVPFPEEVQGWTAQRAAMLAEIGTLRAKMREHERAQLDEVDFAALRWLRQYADFPARKALDKIATLSPCGYCKHPSRSDGVCDYCGERK